MLAHVLGALGVSSGAVLAYTLLLVVRPAPTWDAQYAVAFLGFMLGSALSSVSLGLTCVVEELTLGAPACPGFHASRLAQSRP